MTMKHIRLVFALPLLAGAIHAAPTPQPVTINSQSRTAPQLEVFKASPRTFRVQFKDGATVSDITGHGVFMAWATNAVASAVSTARNAIS